MTMVLKALDIFKLFNIIDENGVFLNNYLFSRHLNFPQTTYIVLLTSKGGGGGG
jgi:hypothetical protein